MDNPEDRALGTPVMTAESAPTKTHAAPVHGLSIPVRFCPDDGADPFTTVDAADKPNNWGLRSYNDQPNSTQWGGENVYDVYSKSDGVALDGTKYSTW